MTHAQLWNSTGDVARSLGAVATGRPVCAPVFPASTLPPLAGLPPKSSADGKPSSQKREGVVVVERVVAYVSYAALPSECVSM